MRSRAPPPLVRRPPPAMATLQDALAYPQQPALLGPLKPAQQQRSRPRPSAPRKQFPRALARFRDRLQCLEERLRLDVNALRQEVRDLELSRSLLEQRTLSTRFSATGAAAQLVREYFGVFAGGFQRFPEGDGTDLRAMRMLHALDHRGSGSGGSGGDAAAAQRVLPPSLRALQSQIETASRQQAFLEVMVDPQLTFQRFVGRDVLVEQWQRYSQCHAGLCMHMLTLEVVPVSEAQQRQMRRQRRSVSGAAAADNDDDARDATVAVHATGRLTAYVTQNTLEQIFPHVLRNAGLAHRLLGAFIEYPFRVEFHVSGDGRISKYDADVDFISALSGVLGNFEDVTLLMRDALISEYCMIGRLDAESAEEIHHAARVEAVEEDKDEEMPASETREPSRVHGDEVSGAGGEAAAGVSKAALQYILS